jgi:hypothetical protein
VRGKKAARRFMARLLDVCRLLPSFTHACKSFLTLRSPAPTPPRTLQSSVPGSQLLGCFENRDARMRTLWRTNRPNLNPAHAETILRGTKLAPSVVSTTFHAVFMQFGDRFATTQFTNYENGKLPSIFKDTLCNVHVQICFLFS